MPLDQTIALGVKPPDPNGPLNTMNSISQFQNSQKDLEVKEYNLRSEQLARAANEVIQAPEGSKERVDLWNHHVDDLYSRGYLNNVEHDQWKRSGPSSMALNQAIARGMDVQKQQAMTGATAGKNAAAESPYKFESTTPGNTNQYPALRQGGPNLGGVGSVTGPGPAGVGSVAPPAVGGPRPGGPVPSSPTVVGDAEGEQSGLYPKPGQSPDVGPAKAPPPPTTATTKSSFANDPYYKTAPVDPIPGADKMPAGPGVVDTGIHPYVKEAGQAALKMQMEDTEPAAAAAQKTKGSLGTMKSILDSGKVTTNSLAEMKMAIAGFINAATGEKDGKTAKSLLGGDLPDAEVLNKETTRMGLLFARQTEGAREAVQAIRIALGANPSMLNTVDGNKKIIGIMNAAADYDIERAKAFKAYSAKQVDQLGYVNTRGFDSWFSENYSPSKFISKAVPYQLPASKTDLQPGVTYEHNGKSEVYQGK